MIQHHTHYKEIDGFDKTIWMTRSEHTKLHQKLRKEGRCNIPPKELAQISTKAQGRSPGYKRYQRKYWKKNKKGIKRRRKEYQEKDKEYRGENMDYIMDYFRKEWDEDEKIKIIKRMRGKNE